MQTLREELQSKLERIEAELEADEWPIAKQRRLRAERDRLEKAIIATWSRP
jgi:hypothetical protein